MKYRSDLSSWGGVPFIYNMYKVAPNLGPNLAFSLDSNLALNLALSLAPNLALNWTHQPPYNSTR